MNKNKSKSHLEEELRERLRDLQLEMLRAVIDAGGTSRADLAVHMNVTKRTVDAWLLPKGSSGRRNMSQSQAERLLQFTNDIILKNAFPVVDGLKATAPHRLQMVEFPAVFRSGVKNGEMLFSFAKVGQEIEHLSTQDGDDWLFITPHMSLQHMESFLWGERAWRNLLHYKQLSFCKYGIYFFSLTRMRPEQCFLEKALTLYGGGCLMGSMKVETEDPYIMIGPTGSRYAFQFEVVEVKANDDIFKKRLAELEAFKAENGHCDVPSKGQLGRWCASQRLAAKKSNYPEDRQERLEATGFRFDKKSQFP